MPSRRDELIQMLIDHNNLHNFDTSAAVVRRILEMRRSGMAYGKIAAALNREEILSPRWHWETHYGKNGTCKYSKLWAYGKAASE